MGQYYRPVLANVEGENVKVYDRSVDGEYMMAKLMEHSWIGNACLNHVAKRLYNTPKRLVWMGDYAEQEDFEGDFKKDRNIPDNIPAPDYKQAWETEQVRGFKGKGIDIDGKFFINHEQKSYVDIDEYIAKSNDSEWVINPISLLTAIGNGRGGGDYGGINEEYVGKWAWNIVEIADSAPADYTKLDIIFNEN